MNTNVRCLVSGLTFLIAVISFSSQSMGQLRFPETPEPGELIQDLANVISADDQDTIRRIQFKAYEDFDTPIVVVTIRSKAQFNGAAVSIERVAHDLFNKWQIGKRNDSGRLINQGILLVVSVGDRKARIELGADWRRDWDSHCDEIMQESIVSRFKKGDYSGGILQGVEQLAEMANVGPDGDVPVNRSLFKEASKPMLEGFNPMPRWVGWLILALGFGTIGLGFCVPEEFQKYMFIAGALIILFALFYWLIIAVLAIFFGRNSDSSSGGWGGGGGFSSGGFSGGGGATGSW